MMNHIQNMQYALRLAARGLGRTAPNPSVGAVIVKDGRIVGIGVTARGGRPHAETQALAMAGEDARGATLYVTLEPCSHTGKTPPCAQALIQAGIAQVVVGCGDSNPKVAGRGVAMLKAAGVAVTENLCEAEARALNEGFFSVIEHGRPFVTVKIATSLDGRTVSLPNESRWITGEAARAHGHLLRASHDAVLTGIGTALADDPALTCRLPGREADSPQRIIVDSNLNLPLTARALPAWVITVQDSYDAQMNKVAAFEKAGSQVYALAQEEGRLSLTALLDFLAQKDITRLLVEGGKALTESFLRQRLADRVVWFRAPVVTGVESSRISDPLLPKLQAIRVGKEVMEIYEPGGRNRLRP